MRAAISSRIRRALIQSWSDYFAAKSRGPPPLGGRGDVGVGAKEAPSPRRIGTGGGAQTVPPTSVDGCIEAPVALDEEPDDGLPTPSPYSSLRRIAALSGSLGW